MEGKDDTGNLAAKYVYMAYAAQRFDEEPENPLILAFAQDIIDAIRKRERGEALTREEYAYTRTFEEIELLNAFAEDAGRKLGLDAVTNLWRERAGRVSENPHTAAIWATAVGSNRQMFVELIRTYDPWYLFCQRLYDAAGIDPIKDEKTPLWTYLMTLANEIIAIVDAELPDL